MIPMASARLWIGFGVLVVVIVVLGYSVVDQAVTIDHLSQEVRRTQSDLRVLQQVANDSLQLSPGADFRSLVGSKYGASHVVKESAPSVLSVDAVGLRFDGGRLVEFVLSDQ